MRRVIVVGAGALGSHVVQFLRSVQDIEIKVIDFDRVERKNVLSQFHGAKTVGKNKAQALSQTMQFMYGLRLQVVPHKLTADNYSKLLGGAFLIIDCLDNAEARKLVQSFARDHDVPCLHGALAADGAFGAVVWDSDFVIDEEPSQGAATCEDGEHLPFIAITSAYLARAAQVFLDSWNDQEPSAERGSRIGFQVHPGGVVKTGSGKRS